MPSVFKFHEKLISSKYVQFIQIRWAETKKDRGSKRISNDDFGYFSKKFAVEYKLLLKTGQLDDALAGRIEPRDYGVGLSIVIFGKIVWLDFFQPFLT